MTKKELIKKIADESGLMDITVKQVLGWLAVVAKDSVELGDEITLPGICIISVANKAERKGTNPKTGESITIPAHKAVKFKPLKALKDAANNNGK